MNIFEVSALAVIFMLGVLLIFFLDRESDYQYDDTCVKRCVLYSSPTLSEIIIDMR